MLLAAVLADLTLQLVKEGGMKKHIEEFTLLFMLVQRLAPATFAEMYVQTCDLMGKNQRGRKAYFEQ